MAAQMAVWFIFGPALCAAHRESPVRCVGFWAAKLPIKSSKAFKEESSITKKVFCRVLFIIKKMLSSLQSPSGHLSSPSSLSSHTHSGKSFVLFFVTMMYIFFTFITEKAERQIPPQFGGQRGFISVNFVQFVLNSINLETKQVELETAGSILPFL